MTVRPFLLLGVVHLASLPGAPRFASSIDRVLEAALRDAQTLIEGGVHGLVIENFGDAPFFPDQVPPVTVAAMTVMAHEIVGLLRAAPGPRRWLGINVLRNDAAAAIAIAASVQADFVRINVHQSAVVADQGILVGRAHETARLRAQLAPHVRLFCDVRVKHAAPLAQRELGAEVEDLVQRGLADAVLVTGEATSRPVDQTKLAEVRAAARGVPVLIASGASAENLARIAPDADGAIIGTAFERDGVPGAPVELARVQRIMRVLTELKRAAPQQLSWSCQDC